MNIQGIGASSGIGLGQAFVYESSDIEIIEDSLLSLEEEMCLFTKAIESASDDIKNLYERAKIRLGEKDAGVFQAHLMFLEDPEFTSGIEALIESGKTSTFAVKNVSDMLIAMFSSMDDDYMKERASDIKDVSDRLINILLGVNASLDSFESPVIIVAEDLTPSMTVTLDPKMVLAFITRVGGKTSHSAIMARNMGIPAVVGLGDISDIESGSVLIVNGDTGQVTLSPTSSELDDAETLRKDYLIKQNMLQAFVGKETMTQDKKRIELVCNIGSDKDIPLVQSNDGEGVGLFRSEFLYMDQESMPSEETQFKAYKAVVESISGPVIIRTLDVGGDKDIPYIKLDEEMNPFLGVRAVRLCLKDSQLFQPQLCALLRASVYGHLKIMFPMVSSLEEVHLIKAELEKAKETLRKRGDSYDSNVEIGIMIEIPSAALMADMFAKEVDFFSIGTNDLVQYTTATDRINQNVSHLYSHYHPAVLRLIKFVAEAGGRENIMVGMCGEAASDPLLIPFLIGAGLNELSVSPYKVLATRSHISTLTYEKCKEYSKEIMNLSTASQVRDYLETVALNQ
ncbi:phosphoenolpyruvate--protein phosphotransferase [Acidaminobacter sp. JC074]|uniref:phosphoenolpyruvate--protein phosphotransferase n=1 Tax=Acidaminobacter sp. JC074 TaxID=2530199 RepID=UPI001F0E55EE|nr:phosphoenolpyruvate--protein phosphotransferase [Acidaminobacter sp. JC074]